MCAPNGGERPGTDLPPVPMAAPWSHAGTSAARDPARRPPILPPGAVPRHPRPAGGSNAPGTAIQSGPLRFSAAPPDSSRMASRRRNESGAPGKSCALKFDAACRRRPHWSPGKEPFGPCRAQSSETALPVGDHSPSRPATRRDPCHGATQCSNRQADATSARRSVNASLTSIAARRWPSSRSRAWSAVTARLRHQPSPVSDHRPRCRDGERGSGEVPIRPSGETC